MSAIVGREAEQSQLQDCLDSDQAEFIAVYGRRRIGKTYLINHFYRPKGFLFELTGRFNANKRQQLRNFKTVFEEAFKPEKPATIDDWDQAFDLLRHEIARFPLEQNIILFFDELPWLASSKSGFMDALDLFWNRYASRMTNVTLVICGSAAAWMIKKVIDNKGGLYARLTRPPIHLKPFTLYETQAFLESKQIKLSQKHVIEIYMAVGGVGHYLNLIPRGLSSAQIIEYLFFSPTAPLASEFGRLYASLFKNPEKYISIIRLLAKKRQGLSQTAIFHASGRAKGGSTSSMLEELNACGFITRIPHYGNKKREALYRLTDMFSLFYLTWVDTLKDSLINNSQASVWKRQHQSPAFKSWTGFTFENVCLQHIRQLINGLDLSVTAIGTAGWRELNPDNGKKCAQIDLIIDRADQCMNLCEIKFSDNDFIVNKTLAEQLDNKKECFREKENIRKTLFTTLITTHGARKNEHYHNSVDNQLTMEVLFKP